MPRARPAAPRALVLGIDGGSLALIEPLIAEGAMPCLAELLRTSRYGETTTTWPAHTAPGWTTFVTARHPGGHGIYQFYDTQDPDYGDRLVGSGDVGCSTVWEWLARQDLSVGLINVPMSHPPRELPGYQLTWPLSRTLRYSSPPELLGELARAGAPFRPDVAAMFQGDHAYLDFALDHVRARGRSIQYLMRTRPVDVVMAVLTEVDRICHHYWHFADPCHPRHESDPGRPEWSDALRAVHAELDTVFGEILALVDDETPVLLVSDHGFGPGRHNLAVNAVLAEAGLLTTTAAADDGRASWFTADGRTVDFGRTRAYMPTPGSYAVNLNVAGRQRDGTVRERDVPALRDEVSALFADLRAPDTGQPVFAAVVPREEAYPGPMCHAAPDLLLVPADEGVLADPGLGGGQVWLDSHQTGMHRYAGLWAYRSATVPAGRHPAPVSLADLMPTLLHDLGLRQPAGVAGRPIAQAMEHRPDPLPFLPDPDVTPTTADERRQVGDDDVTARALAAMGYL